MLKILNPATHALIAKVPADTAAAVKQKYQAARAAQPAWAQRPSTERIDVMTRFREQVRARHEDLAKILTSEVGKPIAQSRNELNGVLGRIDFFINNAAKVLKDEVVFADRGLEEKIAYEPLGVVANISAWNYPYFVGANVFVPALLTGNAVLYKPSEFATLSGLEIAKMLHASGVPQDVFVAVVGGGEIGASLARQPVDGIFFTGSYATGRKIASAAAKRMIKVQLELGGKDPIYVCEDADVKAAAASTADGAFYNTGQSCCAVERIYVHESIYVDFVDAFVATVRGFKIGDPRDDTTYIGPLTRKAQLAVLKRQVADAKKKGANLLMGGKPLTRKGHYFAPTVLSDVDHRMEIMREESFGPVIGIQKVNDDNEATRLMNDTAYGLTAGVYTPDRERAEKILAQIKSGSVYWNCCDRVSPRLPWSGLKHSGIGLTLSTYGIQTFLRPKAWHLRSV
ncbi:MAG: aldehyde dehydrogenase family protein [Betaproteobacteria bacterium]|nr:aldehyde dehydrogenase family protein [Betaproteobacteria bacterium]